MSNYDPERLPGKPPENYMRRYVHGEERLFLHPLNTWVIRYYEPYDHLDHIEHWGGFDKNYTRIIFDPDLIAELEDIGFDARLVSNPETTSVIHTYYDDRQRIIEALGEETRSVDLPEGLGNIDTEWQNFKV